ncbi:nucleolar RNA helicase 2 isoform X3 [Syngnathus acus]|uniref:nucleolar RNA helicase 2 isoform X3 n=1 Tax=Syngnathus acus TaxID=161584 RepID=UPI00188632B0|nr:nucleolar RNA helicase 2 isoform X3 [Syngnathus acus]
MPSKSVVEVKTMEEESDTAADLEALKIKSKEAKKLKKKKKLEEQEEPDSECLVPKKKKKKNKLAEDEVNGHIDEATDLTGITDMPEPPKKKKRKNKLAEDEVNGHIDEATDLTGITDITEPPKKKKKKKSKEAVEKKTIGVVEAEINEHSMPDTPAPTPSQTPSQSDGSESEKEIEETPEQKAGAFSNFRISHGTIQKLNARGVSYLFDIQVQTFDHIYDGHDVLAQARTGTGKTFSFAIPLVEKLQSDGLTQPRGRPPNVLVLTPTRELAVQVARDFKNIAKKLNISCFYGGVPYSPQFEAIRNGIDVLVGTPGRIKDLFEKRSLDLTKLKHVVLDEVDQMLDMGFAEPVEEIISSSYNKQNDDPNPQTLLFSATCPPWVYEVAKKYMRPDCKRVDLIGTKTQRAATTVEHLAMECHWSQRAAVIGDVIQVYSGSSGRTIIFCETKRQVNELFASTAIKQNTQCLHGDIPQQQREVTLQGFRKGTFDVLVATNVAARGLDIPEVDLVIQCSPPNDVDSYIHRSGRTGRAGRMGICICFYVQREEYQLRNVEQSAGITFKRVCAPSTNDLIKSSSKDVSTFLDSVSTAAIEHFRVSAERLIKEKGAVEALAAALAHMSGLTSLTNRSLLTSKPGHTTMQLICSQKMYNLGLAWNTLKEQLGEEVEKHISAMVFIVGQMGVCFDIPEDKVKEFQEGWEDDSFWQLTEATELPQLDRDSRSDGGRSQGGRGRSFGGGRGGNWKGRFQGGRSQSFGGSGGRGGSGRSGGWNGSKRYFNQSF